MLRENGIVEKANNFFNEFTTKTVNLRYGRTGSYGCIITQLYQTKENSGPVWPGGKRAPVM